MRELHYLSRKMKAGTDEIERCDHPHGGGRGKSKGNKHPQSAHGLNAKGLRTRKPGKKGHKTGNKMVVKERPRGKNQTSKQL